MFKIQLCVCMCVVRMLIKCPHLRGFMMMKCSATWIPKMRCFLEKLMQHDSTSNIAEEEVHSGSHALTS